MTEPEQADMPIQPTDILGFWFRELTPDRWFKGGDQSLDAEIRRRFEATVILARDGRLDGWATTPSDRLALIIVLDQFPRNIYRSLPESYSSDAKAQGLSLNGIEQGMDKSLTFAERQFFYMPLMHAEDAGLQAQSLKVFTALRDEAVRLLAFATSHAEAIERFGRFPRRNTPLGRPSTNDEVAYLAQSDEDGAV